jgi:hypothetical protein
MESKMNCPEAQNLIPQYLSGELDEDTRRQVEEHISGCPDCQEGMRREQSLRHLICQSADDPPDDYWDNYNDDVRSRIRGAVAISWRMGCLPAGLWGLIFGGLIVGPICAWLSFGDGLGKVHPDWLRQLLETALLVIVGVAFVFVFWILFKHANRHGLPGYARDERRLQQVMAAKPLLRGTVMAMLILTDLGVSIYLAYQFASNAHLPPAVRLVLGIVLFIGLGSSITPSYYRQMRDYVTGRTNALVDWSAPRASLRKRLRAHPLLFLTALILLSLVAWDMGVSSYLGPPDDCWYQAQDIYEKGDVRSAISTLRTCTKEYGDRYTVLVSYRELGRLYSEAGQLERARQAYSEGIEVYERFAEHPKFYYSKNDQFALLERGAELYIGLGENRKAYELYTAKLRMAPNNAENMYFVAGGYADAGYKDEAVRLYTKLIRDHPHRFWAGLAREALQNKGE